jgi:hypothetical protein
MSRTTQGAAAGRFGCAGTSGAADLTCFRGALTVAEAIDDRAAGQAVEGVGIHRVTAQEVAAEGFVLSIERSAVRPGVRTSHVLRDV